MNSNQKMMDEKLQNIQVKIDEIGNKFFDRHLQFGKDLKMCAFEIGLIRSTLERIKQVKYPFASDEKLHARIVGMLAKQGISKANTRARDILYELEEYYTSWLNFHIKTE